MVCVYYEAAAHMRLSSGATFAAFGRLFAPWAFPTFRHSSWLVGAPPFVGLTSCASSCEQALPPLLASTSSSTGSNAVLPRRAARIGPAPMVTWHRGLATISRFPPPVVVGHRSAEVDAKADIYPIIVVVPCASAALAPRWGGALPAHGLLLASATNGGVHKERFGLVC